MKRIVVGVILSCTLYNASAQITDSAVKVFSTYICNCIDTMDMNQPQAELKKTVTLCKTLSLANLLNKQLISPEMLNDPEKTVKLEQQAFTLLADECDGIKRLVVAMRKSPSFREKNDPQLFTPVAFFEENKMKEGETNERLHVYNNFEKGSKFQRAVDIRWTFETEADALKWHQLKLKENSEDGTLVKDLIILQGAQELKVFREGKGSEQMMKDFGIQQRHHYFLFVYKNIACKIFVATDDKTGTLEVVPFAMAALKRVKEAVK
jgi:hypothetical protein